ncbi:MAG: UDP-N-acetylmuramate dehydrogenase [Clostridiales bacterium]|nr:UDP-N-acetylmuramate dehydrogenase [Clostridiales bacterium]
MQTHTPNALTDALPQEELFFDRPMSAYTTIKVGGPAAMMMEAHSAQQVARAIQAARQRGIPTLLLGNGSNLLMDDAGFDGLVIRFGEAFSQVKLEGNTLTAQAGASLMALSRLTVEHSLAGLEFAAGIPASLGGAALMNAGAYGGEMAHVIRHVDCLDPQGRAVRLQVKDIGYGYRDSRMMREGYTVLSACMELKPGDGEAIRRCVQENQMHRRNKQPLTYPSAGSFFKRPPGYFAGALIEQAGLKGCRRGAAQVSELHAGFLINLGGATGQDFRSLVAHVQDTVEQRSGVWLEPEVRIIGRRGA